MKSSRNVPGRRSPGPLYVAVTAALFGTGVAGAVDLSGVITHPDGTMTFPNVRVVNTPEPAKVSPVATGQPGLKAYIDPATGMLRGPTAEDIAAENLAAQQAAAMNPQGATQFLERIHAQSGAIGVHVGDSQMVFSIVRRQENGELTEVCVIGPEQAAKMMSLKMPSLSALRSKGEANDR